MTDSLLAPYQPAARRAAPLPPLPPPMTMKSKAFGEVGAMAGGRLERWRTCWLKRVAGENLGERAEIQRRDAVDAEPEEQAVMDRAGRRAGCGHRPWW